MYATVSVQCYILWILFKEANKGLIKVWGLVKHTVKTKGSGCYLTNRFYAAVQLFNNRSQMTSICGKKKVAHKVIAECVTDVLMALPQKTAVKSSAVKSFECWVLRFEMLKGNSWMIKHSKWFTARTILCFGQWFHGVTAVT